MNDITLTFGRFAGKKLSEIPDRSYIEWLAGQAIRKQPEARQAAQAFLDEHPAATEPVKQSRSREPGPAPRTYREASRLSWMAGKGYGNAKATLLAARDKDGFLMVVDEEDDEEEHRLLAVFDSGEIHDASALFYAMAYEQVEAVLARYPRVDKDGYLLEVAEREDQEADEQRRSLVFPSQDGKHTVVLLIWDANSIDVVIDGRERGSYTFRSPTLEERNDPQWRAAATVLEADLDGSGAPGPSAYNIGLTPERKLLVEQKIQEVARLVK